MAWALLTAASVLEVVWAVALKYTDGFTRLWPSVIGVSAAAVSFFMLAVALRSLPVGTAYAVWIGLGACGVVTAGVVMFGESMSPLRLVCLALILIGVVGLRVAES